MAGIWSICKNILRPDNTISEQTSVNNRLQQRFLVAGSFITFDSVPGSFRLIDVSYSGVSIECEGERRESVMSALRNKTIEGKISLLGSSCPVCVKFVHSQRERMGFCFSHESPDLLLFLREPIEFMRRGSELSQVQSQYLKERLRDPGWTVLRGDSSIEMRLFANPQGDLVEGILTFLDGKNYSEIVLLNGRLTTRVSVATRAQATEMAQDSGLDHETVRKGIFVCTGIVNTRENSAVRGFMALCLQSLQF